MNYHHLSV